MQNERWLPVVGYEGLYEVSDLGRVRSPRRDILATDTEKGGYCRVNLSRDGHAKHRMVHILVTMAFVGPCPAGYEHNHKSGDKSDNSVANLEFLTKSDNQKHAYAVLGKQRQQGSRHGMAKLTESSVLAIRHALSAGNSRQSVAHQFNISVWSIHKIASGSTWRHV